MSTFNEMFLYTHITPYRSDFINLFTSRVLTHNDLADHAVQ